MTVVSQDTRVRAEQVRMLYEAMPVSIFAALFIASILAVILWSSSIPHRSLLMWLVWPFITSIIRLIFYVQYMHKGDSATDELDRFERNIIIATILAASVWGLLPIVVYPSNITFQVVVAFALAGMSAGAVTSLSFRISTIRLFLFISLVPLILRFMLGEDFILQAMGVMVIAHLVLLLISAQRIFKNTEQNIVLRMNSDRREHELEGIIAERERLDDMKNDFISTVSHELRTPLTSIKGSLGLLVGGAVGEIPKSAKDLLDIAGSNCERLLMLINDILDVQKIESGKLVLNLAPIDIHDFLTNAIELNRGYANEHNVYIDLKENSRKIQVNADSDRLLQVVSNLLSNAAKFSPQNGSVEVGYEATDDQVIIQVVDRGLGIPKEFQKDVFDKFTQADTSDTKKVRGTGLGLSISKHIIEKHNGTIGFESKEGVGSNFYIGLPVFKGAAV